MKKRTVIAAGLLVCGAAALVGGIAIGPEKGTLQYEIDQTPGLSLSDNRPEDQKGTPIQLGVSGANLTFEVRDYAHTGCWVERPKTLAIIIRPSNTESNTPHYLRMGEFATAAEALSAAKAAGPHPGVAGKPDRNGICWGPYGGSARG